MRILIGLLFTVSCFGASLSVTNKPRVLAFEARNGQYVSHGSGYALSVTSGGAVLNLRGHSVRMSVAGGSSKSTLEAIDHMPGRATYLLGRDVRDSYDLYGGVRCRGIYSGIDLVFRGNQEHLEYDLEVGAGRDPARIRLLFDGVDGIYVDRHGDLVLRAGTARIHQPKPIAYQLVAGKRQLVDASYRIDAAGQVRFRTGAYDRRRALVIDPQIVFDQSFGGSGVSMAAGLARDTQGNLYVTGTTNSTDFATVNPVQGHLGTAPLLVTANAGTSWSSPSLSGANSASAIKAAPSAPLIVYAATPIGIFKSADGGTTWAATSDTGLTGAPTALAVDAGSATTLYAATAQGVFVSTDGAASWRASTSGLPAAGILGVFAHPTQAGTVFASGQNPPALFRSTDAGQSWSQTALTPSNQGAPVNAMVFGSNGTIIAATYQALSISTDGGNTWAAGASLGVYSSQELAISPNNPSTLYLVSPSGLQRSTDGGQTFTVVLPAITSTYTAPVAVDPRNPSTVYAVAAVYTSHSYSTLLYRSVDAGQTWSQLSTPYPLIPQSLFISPADSRVFLGAGTQNNIFVTKWSADGSQVLYSTYLGGSQKDGASGIAVDGNGSAYVTGVTSSPDFPSTPGAFQTKLTTVQDVFAAKLSPDGSQLMYSTLLGGDLTEYQCCQPTGSTGIAVDNSGAAVITGFTEGTYPVTANAFESAPVMGCYLSATPSAPTSGNAFVTRIAPGGNTLVYSTLLGGSCVTNGTSVALDTSGNAWVAGWTQSPDFPVTKDALQAKFGGGLYDGYLARFNAAGGLDYATYIGGAGYDSVNAIAFDQSGNIYLTGESGGLSQPASAGAFQPQASASCLVFSIGPSEYYPQGNALVLKLDPAAHSIERLTYLGAPRCLSGLSVAVDGSGEPWISGMLDPEGSQPQTASPFEIGVGQGFISKFSADFTQLLFSTYFDAVAGMSLDSSGLAYVAGRGSPSSAGTQTAYIAKIDPAPVSISLDSVTSVPVINPTYFAGIAAGEVIRILGKGLGPAVATPGLIQSGVLASNVAGVQVTFDGTAVPLLSVGAQEIDLVAPFELATKTSATIQVQYNGAKSNAVPVAVTSVVLQILGVFNTDFSMNSASNPAKAGSVMSLYLAGAGGNNPPSQDGQVNAAPLAAPGMPIQLQLFGTTLTPVPVTFAGAAAGLAAGILQVNFIAPQASSASVNLLTGNTGTQFSVWVK